MLSTSAGERETLQQHMTTSRKQRVILQSGSTHCTCSIAQSVRPFVGRCVRVSPRHPQLESLELAVREGQRLDGVVVAGRPWCTCTRQPTNRPITTPTDRESASRLCNGILVNMFWDTSTKSNLTETVNGSAPLGIGTRTM